MLKEFKKQCCNFNFKLFSLSFFIVFLLLCWADKTNKLTTVLVESGFLTNSYLIVAFMIIMVFILLISFGKFIYLNYIKIKSLNILDIWLIVLFADLLLYFFSLDILKSGNKFFQRTMLPWIIMFLAIIILIRIFIILWNLAKIDIAPSDGMDLEQIISNPKLIQEKSLFFIEEDAVAYDLLKRDMIINELKNICLNCNVSKKLIIGLKGKWGSGKSTIINILRKAIDEIQQKDDKNKKKHMKNRVIFVEINPWKYDNNVAFLYSIFDAILDKLDIKFSYLELITFLETNANIISKVTKKDIAIFNNFNNNKTINRITENVNNCLIQNKTKIVFILDNIERASDENLLGVLNLIYNFFEFKNIIYLISYDPEILAKKFENLKIDKSYLEKIINIELEIPKIDKDILREILKRTIKNISSNETIFTEDIYDVMISMMDGIRDLKRLLNSSYLRYSSNKDFVNRIDIVLLQMICMKSRDLYEEIYKNKQFFSSYDLYILGSQFKMAPGEYNQETQKYFEKLFSNETYNKFSKVLYYLFPNAKLYLDYPQASIDYWGNSSKNQDEIQKSNREKRISNAKYFDIYFYAIENVYLILNNKIRNFIELINKKHSYSWANKEYKKLLKEYQNEIQMYVAEGIGNYLENVQNNLDILVAVLFNSLDETDDSIMTGYANSTKRTFQNIGILLNKLTDIEFNKFVNKNLKCKNLRKMEGILYFRNSEFDEIRYQKLKTDYENLKNMIILNNINIYDFKNYAYNNLSSFESNETKQKLLENRINSQNVLLFIIDRIQYGVTEIMGITGITVQHNYTLHKKDLSKIVDVKKIKKLVKDSPECDLKKIILNLMKNWKAVSNERYNLKLLAKEYFEKYCKSRRRKDN